MDSSEKSIFQEVSSRISLLKILKKGKPIYLINVYAPTQPSCQKNPDQRRKFYEQLEKVLQDVPNRATLFLIGDFNAKTGSSKDLHPEVIGNYGKGLTNENGERLIDLALKNNLLITNTFFKHRFAHVSTWTSPGLPSHRRNQIRNQIDYIQVRKDFFKFVNDCRAFSGISTNTDHRLVVIKIKDNYITLQNNNFKAKGKDRKYVSFDENEDRLLSYKNNIEVEINQLVENNAEPNTIVDSPDCKWDNLKTICLSSAKKFLTVSKESKKDLIISQLSTKQKEIRKKIIGCNNRRSRKKFKQQRNKVLHEIQKRKKFLQQQDIQKKINEFNSNNRNQNKVHKCMKKVFKVKKPELLIKNEHNEVLNQEKATELITSFYKAFFNMNTRDSLGPNEKTNIQNPYTGAEIKTAVKQLSNPRSPDESGLTAEHFKCAPDIFLNEIADVLNISIYTGNFPKDLSKGLLIPLHKPGKEKGKAENTRPIIILPILRKITAKCLINRIYERVNNEIPTSQAAYRKGRGTIEHIFSMKSLIDKTLTSVDYNLYISM